MKKRKKKKRREGDAKPAIVVPRMRIVDTDVDVRYNCAWMWRRCKMIFDAIHKVDVVII